MLDAPGQVYNSAVALALPRTTVIAFWLVNPNIPAHPPQIYPKPKTIKAKYSCQRSNGYKITQCPTRLPQIHYRREKQLGTTNAGSFEWDVFNSNRYSEQTVEQDIVYAQILKAVLTQALLFVMKDKLTLYFKKITFLVLKRN